MHSVVHGQAPSYIYDIVTQSRDYLVVQISDLHTRVTTTCRALLLDYRVSINQTQ